MSDLTPPNADTDLTPPGAVLEPGLETAIEDAAQVVTPGTTQPDPNSEARADGRETLVQTDALSADDILAIVASASAFGLNDRDAEAYMTGLQNDPMIRYGLRMSQLEKTLARLGLTMGGGELPTWLSVSLGLGVLGFGVYQHRSRYGASTPAQFNPVQASEVADPEPGFDAGDLVGGEPSGQVGG
jgi:hypothetical protein